MNLETQIHDYETGGGEIYTPPPEVEKQIRKWFGQRLYQVVGQHPWTHKLVGYLSHNTQMLDGILQGRMRDAGMTDQDIRALYEQYDFQTSHELFTFNHPREQFGNKETEHLLPSDGFLSHEAIDQKGYSKILNGVRVDIAKMLGFNMSDIPSSLDTIQGEGRKVSIMRKIQPVLSKLIQDPTSGLSGYHDLAILKPEHKHVCSVPLKSKLKFMYRVGMDGQLYPHDQGVINLSEKVYSTDPAFVRESGMNVFDGNQRMVFVMEAEIGGKKMEYIMVAHAASLVSGIEPLINIGDTITPGELLFNFHQGSSLSVLLPRQFFEHFEFIQALESQTTNGNLLKVLEGQRVYVPKGVQGSLRVNSNTNFVVGMDEDRLVREKA